MGPKAGGSRWAAVRAQLEGYGFPKALWPALVPLLEADEEGARAALDFGCRPCVDDADSAPQPDSVCTHSPVVAVAARLLRPTHDVFLLRPMWTFAGWEDARSALRADSALASRVRAVLCAGGCGPYGCPTCGQEASAAADFWAHRQAGCKAKAEAASEAAAPVPDPRTEGDVFAALPNHLYVVERTAGGGAFCVGDAVSARLSRCREDGNVRGVAVELPDGQIRLVVWPLVAVPKREVLRCESVPTALEAADRFIASAPKVSGLAGCFAYEAVELLPAARRLRFTFSYGGLLRFPVDVAADLTPAAAAVAGRADLDAAVWTAAFHLGLTVLPCVALGFPVTRVVIRAGPLTEEQVAFWHDVYVNCLAEQCLMAGLDRDLELTVVADSTRPPRTAGLSSREDGQNRPGPGQLLVPLGGGKDSIVVYEMMRRQGLDPVWFFLGGFPGEFEAGCYRAVVAASGSLHPVVVFEQSLAWQGVWQNCTWPLHRRDAPEATPWAAQCCFASVLAALLTGARYVAVGNERSANEGNGQHYRGQPVNHQFDKAFPFELAAHQYIQRFIAADVYYFSALQPWWEVQVCQEFCRHPQYFPAFLSCNEALRDVRGGQRWCRRCAKCAFVFLMLSAFLPPAVVEEVFGANLFRQPVLQDTFLALLGRAGAKPLECVGTAAEARLALALACRQYAAAPAGPPPPLLEGAEAETGLEHAALLAAADGPVALWPGWLERPGPGGVGL